uniref:FtsX-like permease family protein n=1 Tax=Desulfosarcina cetonica TaxID=90730 RepID=UPI00155DC9E3
QAIQADLAAALPWPVRITDRSSSALDFHTRALRQGAVGMLAGVPALLALLLIVTAVVVERRGNRAHQALLKSMGWTTGDLVRLQVFQALIIATPALLGGMAAAVGMVFWPPLAGITARWITGGQMLPMLVLDSHGAGLIVLEIIAMVGLPYLAAVFLTTLRAAAGDPGTDLESTPWH